MDRQSAAAAREMNKKVPTSATIPKWIIMCCRPLWALSIPFHFDNETVLEFYRIYMAREWLPVDFIFAHSMYRAGTAIFSSFSSSSFPVSKLLEHPWSLFFFFLKCLCKAVIVHLHCLWGIPYSAKRFFLHCSIPLYSISSGFSLY